jgi:hypothetical protein
VFQLKRAYEPVSAKDGCCQTATITNSLSDGEGKLNRAVFKDRLI